MSPADWGEAHFEVPVGPHRGKKYSLKETPYVREILECLQVDSPHTRVAVKKSAQTGVSTLALVWFGTLIDTAPDDMMYVLPTLSACTDFIKERVAGAFRDSTPLARKILPVRSRSGEGSTTRTKVFPGGKLIFTGANSSNDLASKTVRFAVRDEIDRWPLDLDDQGDPMAMVDARQTAFTRLAKQKVLDLSTPTVRGASRIDAAHDGGDQRIWEMPCPHCGTAIDFRFEHFRSARLPPRRPHYIAQCCGCEIEPWQQRGMVLAGRWRATQPGPGRYPSFFINSLSSLLTSWEKIAQEYWDSRGDPTKEMTFQNLWLGLSWEVAGVDVDPAKIARNAEHYPRDEVPAWCGRAVLVADVQDDRIEWAVYGFGPGVSALAVDQTLISTGVIPGPLSDERPWEELDALGGRPWPHANGRSYPVDLRGIDSGGHWTQTVYRFVAKKPGWRALKGASKPDAPLLSSPTVVKVVDKYKRVLSKIPLYFVGTHEPKLWLSHALKAIETGAVIPGRLRITSDLVDEVYARQLTAEYIVMRERRNGQVHQDWERIKGQANEALDLAVYARALAFGLRPNGLGLARLSERAWSSILIERHGLPDHPTLFDFVPLSPANPGSDPPPPDQPEARDRPSAPIASPALPPAPPPRPRSSLAAALASLHR